ncbi:hypothetical protein M514_09344 [Trichuris suis]|uniref:Uncharacterized protein n=1 Tax=Trichuris suis TaxID=68888 RepID=A0A085NG95_9BILA|nr:hypothetical protein M513_09344 [Trichuris suis]KFD68491.1 hypothetical protein M514_09344 [Trichuris suis]
MSGSKLDNDSRRSPPAATSILFLDFVEAITLLNPHSTKYVEGNAMKKVSTFSHNDGNLFGRSLPKNLFHSDRIGDVQLCRFEGQSNSLGFLCRLQRLIPQMHLQSNLGYPDSPGHEIFLPCPFEFASGDLHKAGHHRSLPLRSSSGLGIAKVRDDLCYANRLLVF